MADNGERACSAVWRAGFFLVAHGAVFFRRRTARADSALCVSNVVK